MSLYFDIENIRCAYRKNQEKQSPYVLEIEQLKIPKGEVVFIVGQSGCGKSTILETLGLMNNTMCFTEDSYFRFNTPTGKTIDYLKVWSGGNKILSDIRRKHFSFIFQQTNLMKNFNIYQNIAVTKMLQKAKEIECIDATMQALNNVGLEEFYCTDLGVWKKDAKVFDKHNEASGGQQQRIAFARAIVAQFDILFCDEPTGNLDPDTADLLMKYLTAELKKREGATAVIVSHDLPLAMKYGDRIIKIFKKKSEVNDNTFNEYYGSINSNSQFVKSNEGWICNGELLTDNNVLNCLKQA